MTHILANIQRRQRAQSVVTAEEYLTRRQRTTRAQKQAGWEKRIPGVLSKISKALSASSIRKWLRPSVSDNEILLVGATKAGKLRYAISIHPFGAAGDEENDSYLNLVALETEGLSASNALDRINHDGMDLDVIAKKYKDGAKLVSDTREDIVAFSEAFGQVLFEINKLV